MLESFPPVAVISSGSPLTVARPSRISTGFLTRERPVLHLRPAGGFLFLTFFTATRGKRAYGAAARDGGMR